MRMEKNRQRRKKRRLIIGIILITLLIILSAIYMWKKMQEQQVENEQKEIEAKMEENEKKLEEEKEYNGMKIKNIIINKNEKDIELKATIQNTTSKEFKAKKVTIVFLNDEKVKELKIQDINEKLKEDIAEVCKELPTYKRITDIEIRKEEFEKTTTKKIKR